MAAEETRRSGNRWVVATASAAGYHRDEEHVEHITQRRMEEWEQMETFIDGDTCLMNGMRRILNDVNLMDHDEGCGKCGICRSDQPELTSQYSMRLANEAVEFIKNSKKTFVCKKEAPIQFTFRGRQQPNHLPPGLHANEGRVLSYWTDIGWGSLVQEGKERARFSDELVDALARMIQNQWKPWTPRKNWGWVTCVPSNSDSHKKLVPDFAKRLADRLGLLFMRVVVKVGENEPQKGRKNNYHRCTNLDGIFKIKEQVKLPRGPVLLVDDIVRSTWTVTVIAGLLRQAGSGPVFPVALALIGSED